MIDHYVTIEFVNEEFSAKCACGSFNKRYSSRDEARSKSHLHLAGVDVDVLELALAGKVGHD